MVAPPIATLAFKYCPAGTVTVANGVVVPAKLEISTVTGLDTNCTVAPPSEVRVTLLMMMLRDATRSPGPSPIEICVTEAVAGLFVLVRGLVVLDDPPPHATAKTRSAISNSSKKRDFT
jgi:hypothetical protein